MDGGMVVVMILSLFLDVSGSLAATGGPVASVALAGMMVVTLLGSWGALWIVNRWRYSGEHAAATAHLVCSSIIWEGGPHRGLLLKYTSTICSLP